MSTEYSVRIIEKEDVLSIRSIVLRNGIPPAECIFPRDELPSTFHLGGYLTGKLICIGSFYEEANDTFTAPIQYHLRGMATLPEFRGQQAGTLLIKEAERIMAQRGANFWWCNARVSAVNYYEKLGLKAVGEPFIIEGVGSHKLMCRELQK